MDTLAKEIELRMRFSQKAVCAIFVLITVLAMLTASDLFGAIGETLQQFEPRKADKIFKVDDGYTHLWVGNSVTHSAWFWRDKAYTEGFWFNDGRKMTVEDIGRFLKPYNWLKRVIKKDSGAYSMVELRDPGNDDLMLIVTYRHEDNMLCVYTPSSWARFGWWEDVLKKQDVR
jgi:hypothetical protein